MHTQLAKQRAKANRRSLDATDTRGERVLLARPRPASQCTHLRAQ